MDSKSHHIIRSSSASNEQQVVERMAMLTRQGESENIVQLVSDNSSSVESQDDNLELIIQEKILKHLVEPERLYQHSPTKISLSSPRDSDRETMRRENQTQYRMSSLDRAFECNNFDDISDEEDAILQPLSITRKKENNPARSKRVHKEKQQFIPKIKNSDEEIINLQEIIQNQHKPKQKQQLPRLTIDQSISLIDTQQQYNTEYLTRGELYSSRLLQGPNGIDAQQILTHREGQLEKRAKQKLQRQGLMVCEIVYNTLCESDNQDLLCSKDVLFKLNLLNKKLRKVLNSNMSIFFLSQKQRLQMLVQKCNVFTKQIPYVKQQLKIVNKNRYQQNDGKVIYNYLVDIVFDKVILTEGAESNMDKKTLEQIKCDLARTNTTQRSKTKQGQLELERVLRAIAFLFPGVGYCQGMNFIVSVLLHIADDQEYLALFIFVHFLQDKNLKMESLFVDGLPELAVMNFAFEKSIKKFCPKLFGFLRSVDMKTEYFTFKWNMTLFSCFLPVELLVHIFDLFALEGWPAIYKIGISLLNNFLGEKLMEQEGLMEISQYLRDEVRRTENYSPSIIRAIIVGAHHVNIVSDDLVKLKEEFYVELAQQKIKEHKEDFQDLGVAPVSSLEKSASKGRSASKKETQTPVKKEKEEQVIANPSQMSQKELSNMVLAQARQKLDAMDPHAKEDINRFQEKLRKVDKQVDVFLMDKLNSGKEYASSKDEFLQIVSKKKALQSTFVHIIDQYDNTLKQMSYLRSLLENESKSQALYQPQVTFNIGKGPQASQPQVHFAIIENTMSEIETTQSQLDDQEIELIEMNKRLKKVQTSLDMIKGNYKSVKRVYFQHKSKLKDQLIRKERIANQMNGFLLMYEMKRQEMFKDLSFKLKLDDVNYR